MAWVQIMHLMPHAPKPFIYAFIDFIIIFNLYKFVELSFQILTNNYFGIGIDNLSFSTLHCLMFVLVMFT